MEETRAESTPNSDKKQESSQTALDHRRSPLSISKLEILVAVLIGIATWFGLRFILQGTLPYPCGEAINGEPISCGWTYEKSWTEYGHPLFSSFALPMVIILSISAIFLVRAIRKDVLYFSSIGHFALAWPLVSFPLLNTLSFLSLYCLPIGLGLAIVAFIKMIVKERNWGDLIALPLSIAWVCFAYVYFDHWWMAYGD